MQKEARDTENEMEKYQYDHMNNAEMFKQSKNYLEDVQQKIRDTVEENEKLIQENYRLNI